MKNLKFGLTIGTLFMLCALNSCSKFENSKLKKAVQKPVTNEQTAMENFSIALSKAVCTHKEVRDFLKGEALKHFDNDYDVFYPFVKNTKISDLGTFREILTQEMASPLMIDEIESIIPTLTVYVSDVTWIDSTGFCAKNWDTKDYRAAITYKEKDGICRKLYSNGYYLGEIETGTIPGGAVLIVKKNERVMAMPAAKSGKTSYVFIDDVFDASKNEITTKGRHSGKYSTSWIAGQNPGDNSDIISAQSLNKLNPDIIAAYNMFKGNPYAVPNDFIYYGMTPDSPNGRLRYDVRSAIVRFKISSGSFEDIFDDFETDPQKPREKNFVDSFETDDNGHGVGAQPSASTIYSKLWADGALEIDIKVFMGDGKGGVIVHSETVCDVKASNLFTVKDKAIKKEQWWSSPIKWYITWRYSIICRDERTLVEKWYYLSNPIDLPTWDFTNNSAYSITVSEIDSGATITKDIGCVTKRANTESDKLTMEGDATIGPIKITGKKEFGWSFSDEIVNSSSTKVSWVSGNDLLVTRSINYSDKYIKAPASASSYHVYSHGTDRFTFTILPYIY